MYKVTFWNKEKNKVVSVNFRNYDEAITFLMNKSECLDGMHYFKISYEEEN